MNAIKRREIFRLLREANSDPISELHYASTFQLLVAVILSAQATDQSVNRATSHLFARASTPAAMLSLGKENLEDAIKTIGLYRNKAKHIITCCQQLIERHDGEVPRNRTELESLAGVGRKTASVILNIAFGEATIAVDTHVFRVSNRTGLASGKNPLEVELNLLHSTPKEFAQNAHHWLILHGRYVCRARKPNCPACLINALCEFSEKTHA